MKYFEIGNEPERTGQQDWREGDPANPASPREADEAVLPRRLAAAGQAVAQPWMRPAAFRIGRNRTGEPAKESEQ